MSLILNDALLCQWTFLYQVDDCISDPWEPEVLDKDA